MKSGVIFEIGHYNILSVGLHVGTREAYNKRGVLKTSTSGIPCLCRRRLHVYALKRFVAQARRPVAPWAVLTYAQPVQEGAALLDRPF